MKVTNLTDKVQKLTVRALSGDRESFDLFVQPRATVDIDWHYQINSDDYQKIFSFGNSTDVKVQEVPETPEVVKQPEPVIEQPEEVIEEVNSTPVVEPVIETVDETPNEPENPTSYVCEICGAEYGSERGLKSHMSKAHK